MTKKNENAVELKDNQFVVTLSDDSINRIAKIVEESKDNKTFADFDIALDEIVRRGIRSVEHTLDHSRKAKAKNESINALLKAATPEELEERIAALRESLKKK